MRRGIVPLAFAVVLTIAAGLSLAEEHAREPAAGSGRAADRNPSAMTGPGQNGQRNEHSRAEPGIGVGSRALTGHDDWEPSGDERTR
jgi:hypothetical protein